MTENPERTVARRELDTDVDRPTTAVVEAVADIEGRNVDELGTIYECTDDVLDGMFSTPPVPDAKMEVSFTYEGYRITVNQSGDATFAQFE